MDSDVENKQAYLRKEIIDNGYNPEEFMAFFLRKKGDNALQLENWSIEELNDIVSDFRAESAKRANDYAKKESKAKIDPNYDLKDPKANDLFSPFTDMIICDKQEKSPLTDMKKARIIISDPELVAGGLFSFSYYSYLVTTSCISAKCRRTFSDFEWLRNKLVDFYPGIFVPPIPVKPFFDRMGIDFINKRVRFLQKFLDSLMFTPVLRSSIIIYEFLTLNRDDFEKVKRSYNSIPSPVSLKHYQTMEGIFEINITEERDLTAQQIMKLMNQKESLLTRLNAAFTNLMYEFTTVSQRMKEVSAILGELHAISEASSESDRVKQVYQMLTDLTNVWGNSYLKQSEFVNLELREFFKFINKEYEAFHTLALDFENTRYEYVTFGTALKNKKEYLFDSKTFSKWEIIPEGDENIDYTVLSENKELAMPKMCSNETKELQKYKRSFGYYLTNLLNEYGRLVANHGRRFKHHFQEVSVRNKELLADSFHLLKLITTNV